MARGFTTAAGLIGGSKSQGQQAQLMFVVTGSPTSPNPIKAFQQGVAGEQANRLLQITGGRCERFGFLELYANDEPDA